MLRLALIIVSLITFTMKGDDNKVARVIYSEASPICTPQERWLVGSVIKNRIKHVGFKSGKLKTMLDVVNQKNAFECINHDANTNWRESKYIRASDSPDYDQAIYLSTGSFTPKLGIVFFLTKGTPVPRGMINKKYWTLKKEISTQHFDFYSIKPKLI